MLKLIVKLALVALTISALAYAFPVVGVAAAQDDDIESNQTVIDDDGYDVDSTSAVQLETATVVDVEFEGGTAVITVDMDIPGSVVVQDQSQVARTGGGEIRSQSFRLSSGMHEIRMDLVGTSNKVAVMQGSRGYVFDSGMTFGILSSSPGVGLVQLGVASGAMGLFLSLIINVRRIRRKHDTTFKEVFSGQRVRIQDGTIDDWRDRVLANAKRHWVPLSFAGIAFAWGIAAWLIGVRGPIAVWSDIGDAGRLFVIASLVVAGVGYIPVQWTAMKLWAPAKDFVMVLDARDVIDTSLEGFAELEDADVDDIEDVADELQEKENLDAVELYSGSPENVQQMKTHGKPADIETPAGTAYLVEDFSPQKNTAIGTWPGTANDIQLIADRSKIDANKEILREESQMLRTLLGAMPALSVASDTSAMRAVDREIRELVNVDSDPVDSLLDRASRGTRFEGYYSDTGNDDDDDDNPGYEQLVDGADDGDDGDNDGDDQ